jgi:hypothetical protein
MGAKEIHFFFGKSAHGVMICDVVPCKNTNMAYQGFKEKIFTKNCMLLVFPMRSFSKDYT